MNAAQVFLLTVTLITPPDKQDETQSHRMPSLEQCEAAAHAWLQQDAHKLGYIGLAARCAQLDDPDDQSEEN
jgi:hypothetical protein